MLICMQDINFIAETEIVIGFFDAHFFLKILQGNSKLVILGSLGMPSHTQLKL